MYDELEAAAALERIRTFCLALPESSERPSHGSPAWFVREKKTFVMFLDDHHSDGLLAIWCAAPAGDQEQRIEHDSQRFFRPPYVGHRGWLGVKLDAAPDWDEVEDICIEAWRQVAPKRLVNEFDAPSRRV